jgi:hypothetical protein
MPQRTEDEMFGKRMGLLRRPTGLLRDPTGTVGGAEEARPAWPSSRPPVDP